MKEMRKIPLTIEALSPLVLTAGSQGAILTESGDAISGSIVRGMIAARFIEAQNLGRAAHESEAFRRLFAGALKFSAAYPSKGGESAMRLPLSLQKDKLSSALADFAASDGTALKGYKPLKGCGIVRGAAICARTARTPCPIAPFEHSAPAPRGAAPLGCCTVQERTRDARSGISRAAQRERRIRRLLPRRIFAASASASNFVGVWNMRRPTQFGLDAGSIFELKKASPWTSRDAAALAALLAEGAGSRTEEGFGRLALWTVDAPTLFEATQERPERRPVKSERARAIVRAVLRRRIAQSVRLAAYKDAAALTGKLAGMTHAFARLEAMLGPRENLEGAPARFRAKFAAEVGAKRTPLARHLEGVKLGAAELRDILRGERPELSPYASLDLSAEVPQELAEDAGFSRPVLKDDGEIFYDYWLWFFRHARKRAVQQRKEVAD